MSLITENDLDAVRNALRRCKEMTLERTLGDRKNRLERPPCFSRVACSNACEGGTLVARVVRIEILRKRGGGGALSSGMLSATL